MIYKEVVSFEDIKKICEENPDELICYDTVSAWWCILTDNEYRVGGHIPASPHGSVLMQTEISNWINGIEEKKDHYGKHGIKAFMSSYHGNITLNGNPCAIMPDPDSDKSIWDLHNDLIDASINEYKRKTSPDERVALLNKLMKEHIDPLLPDDVGATLLLFPLGTNGTMQYISSAEREDMAKSMQALLDSWLERGYYEREYTPREQAYLKLMEDIVNTPNNYNIVKMKMKLAEGLEKIK